MFFRVEWILLLHRGGAKTDSVEPWLGYCHHRRGRAQPMRRWLPDLLKGQTKTLLKWFCAWLFPSGVIVTRFLYGVNLKRA
jgi:hypothetical protein|tara:strand:- start:216 stop:458 length:243 start_codon:yes stop_codon:yes gene_type:complete